MKLFSYIITKNTAYNLYNKGMALSSTMANGEFIRHDDDLNVIMRYKSSYLEACASIRKYFDSQNHSKTNRIRWRKDEKICEMRSVLTPVNYLLWGFFQKKTDRSIDQN